jgi:hypothetical protein
MEIIGKYKVRTIKDERLIKAPEGAWGEYVLKVHSDGSFSYYPNEGQKANLGTRYVVKDPNGLVISASFKDEPKAFEWKQKMEREHGHVFRMDKVFGSSNGIKVLGPYT